MHAISSREVSPVNSDPNEGDTGIIVSIEPPITVKSKVVKSFFHYGTLSGVKGSDADEERWHSIALIGSTQKATSIYVGSNDREYLETAANEAMERAAELISLLGSTATVSGFTSLEQG